jgi:hypothetical protein
MNPKTYGIAGVILLILLLTCIITAYFWIDSVKCTTTNITVPLFWTSFISGVLFVLGTFILIKIKIS